MNDQTHPDLHETPIGIDATGMRRETDSMGEIEKWTRLRCVCAPQ